MTWNLLLAQSLNGLQYGLLLFLLAAGLTLVLGIMNFVNLAHGSLYMLGAYLGAAVFAKTGSFLVAGAVAVLGTMLIGLIVERGLDERDDVLAQRLVQQLVIALRHRDRRRRLVGLQLALDLLRRDKDRGVALDRRLAAP